MKQNKKSVLLKAMYNSTQKNFFFLYLMHLRTLPSTEVGKYLVSIWEHRELR